MIGISCFRTTTTGELYVQVLGATAAPTIVDEDSDQRVQLRPAYRAGFPGIAESWINGGHRSTPGAYHGELALEPGAVQARLRLEVDGAVHRMRASWPAPAPVEPQAAPAPSRRRRS